MQEIRVSFFQYLPVIEILWNKNLRREISFLKNSSSMIQAIAEDLKTEGKRKTSPLTRLHLLGYGSLKWKMQADLYIYLRKMKNLIYDNQPLRPIIPFSAKTRKWFINRNSSLSLSNATSTINFFPSLCAEVKKSFSITGDCKNEFPDIVHETKDFVYRNQNDEKIRIMRMVFSNFSSISLELSDIITIIETTIENYHITNKVEDLSKLKRIKNIGWMKIDKTEIVVVYSNPLVKKKFRERVLRSISYVFLLKSLRMRINYLLDQRIDRNISFEQKIEFIEYSLAVMNHEFYSMKNKKSYLLPLHYQRVAFHELYLGIGEKEASEQVKLEIINLIDSWLSYEKCGFLFRDNIVTSKIRNQFCNEKLILEPPNLSDRETAIIGFLKKEFIDQAKKDRLSRTLKDKKLYYGGRSANHIRTNIFGWLRGRFNVDIFTVRELRENPIKIMEVLELKGYINVINFAGSKPDRLYVLNLDNPYILKILLDGMKSI